MTTTTSDSTATETEDRLAILELIERLVLPTPLVARCGRSVAATTTSSKRTLDGWRIAGLTFTIQWATGNIHIVELAAAGANDSEGRRPKSP